MASAIGASDEVITWARRRAVIRNQTSNATQGPPERHAEHQERAQAAHIVDQPAEVLPEEPGDEGQRQEHRGQPGQLLDGRIAAAR
jgi:hypothetical protein